MEQKVNLSLANFFKTLPVWNVEKEIGYKPISSFWQDFSIAERFGKLAILDTYARALKEWKSDYKMFTELVMVLNHKIFSWYERNDTLASIYNDLWTEADALACQDLKGEELAYFYQTTN